MLCYVIYVVYRLGEARDVSGSCRRDGMFRKGTNGVRTNGGHCKLYVFLTEGLFGTPVNLLLSSPKCFRKPTFLCVLLSVSRRLDVGDTVGRGRPGCRLRLLMFIVISTLIISRAVVCAY